MPIAIALILSSAALVATVLQGGWVLYPLLFSLALFFGLHCWRGMAPAHLARMAFTGVQRSLGVINILLLIGVLIAAWMASGTVAALVYYGLQLIQPRLFVLSAFLLTGVVSVLIGTSFGSVGTIGLALMIMARGANVPEALVAGAIIAGAYVGDRCSPMSSSANLVATITDTDLYANLKAMVLTSRIAFGVTLGAYGLASWRYPLQAQESPLQTLIPEAFSMHPVTLTPAIAILLLIALRVPVKRTMLASLGLAIVLAVGFQGYELETLLRFLAFGFQLEGMPELSEIIQGGGLLDMGRVCLVVVVSTALAGLLTGTQTFRILERWLSTLPQGRPLFFGTTIISLLMAAYGCTQTIAILLTHQLVQGRYAEVGAANQQVAIDLENTAVVVSPIVPWNIAGLVPATILSVGFSFIPFALYLYLLPLANLFSNPRTGANSLSMGVHSG